MDLKDATLKDIVTERPDLVQAIKDGKDSGTVVSSTVKDTQGRIDTWIEESRDLGGVLISKRVDAYTYYKAGEVNEIIQERYKGKLLVKKERIKHYTDGRQPTIAAITIPIIPKQ